MLAVEEADPTTKERSELWRFTAQAEAEVILVSAFQKESSFLWKEEWKARQVDLPCVNFGLGEIRVGRKDRDQLWRRLPGNFSPCGRLPSARTLAIEFLRFSDTIRRNFYAPALLYFLIMW